MFRPFSRRRNAQQKDLRRTRRLAFERLEDRRLLTTFNVTNVNDAGAGSLRDAIDDANGNPGEDKIFFAAAVSGQTINLSSSLPQISGSVKIQNKNAQNVVVDGQDTAGVRPFNIGPLAKVTLKSLTITGGNLINVTDGIFGGGGVANQGELTINSCTVTRNQVSNGLTGGGVLNLESGTLTIKNSTVSNNHTFDSGAAGGISNDGVMSVVATRVTGNVSEAHAGGIANSGPSADATIRDSTIAGNVAGFDGGAIANFVGASLTVERSTLYGNRAGRAGGGIHVNSGEATFLNTTIAHNLSNTGEGGAVALFNDADATFVNCTIALNADVSNLPESAGGIAKISSGTLNVRNTIIAENSAGSGSAGNDVEFADLDENTNNLIGAFDPHLGPLADNGGPTQTMALLKGNFAIDAGSNAAANNAGLATDQRGLTRIVGGTVDIGAVESQAGEPVLLRSGANGSLTASADSTRADSPTGEPVAPARVEALVTFKVTDKGDAPGTPGTLRDAIEQANANPGADVIKFGRKVKGKSIKLQASLPQITDDLTINGPVTIDGQGIAGIRPLDIAPDILSIDVTLNMLTVTGGHIDAAINGTTDGGGILNRGGVLTLNQSTVTANNITAGNSRGGGVANRPGGTLTLIESTVSNNRVSGSGGGIDNDDATLNLTNSKVISNFSALIGGIANQGASSVVTIDDSAISANKAGGGIGGLGIYAGSVTLRRSTISGNRATEGLGGGIALFNGGTVLSLLNCTVAYNISGSFGQSGTSAGGILQGGGDLTVVNSTIVGNVDTLNDAQGAGGIAKTGGTLSLSNTVIAGNFAGPNSIDDNVELADINLITNDSIGGDPRLGPLQDNGGPTHTMAPLAGSPLINAGSNVAATNAGLTTDQRGLTRIVDGTVDIGAVETQLGEPLP